MALEDIFRALEEQADKECEDILSAARGQAEAIAEDAAEQAESLCAACVAKTDTSAQLKAAKATNAARLDSKKRVASVKDTAVNDAFDAAMKRMGSLRGSDAYPTVFRALLEEAVDGVEGEMSLLVDPADEELARKTAGGLGIEADVRPDISTTGGVTVLTGGGRIMRRNTLEDRMEKVQQMVQSEVAEILFS